MPQGDYGQADGEFLQALQAVRQLAQADNVCFKLLEIGVIGRRLVVVGLQFGFEFAFSPAAQVQGGRKRINENNAVNLLPRIENVFALGFTPAFCAETVVLFFGKRLDDADAVGVEHQFGSGIGGAVEQQDGERQKEQNDNRAAQNGFQAADK